MIAKSPGNGSEKHTQQSERWSSCPNNAIGFPPQQYSISVLVCVSLAVPKADAPHDIAKGSVGKVFAVFAQPGGIVLLTDAIFASSEGIQYSAKKLSK